MAFSPFIVTQGTSGLYRACCFRIAFAGQLVTSIVLDLGPVALSAMLTNSDHRLGFLVEPRF